MASEPDDGVVPTELEQQPAMDPGASWWVSDNQRSELELDISGNNDVSGPATAKCPLICNVTTPLSA